MFVNVTAAGEINFSLAKKKKKIIKGENLCFFFPGMTRGFGNAVEDNLPTKFQRHGARRGGLVDGALSALFSLPPLRWGRFISRYAATEAPEQKKGRGSIDPSREEPGVVGRKVVVVGMFVPGNEEDLIEDVRGGLFSPRIIRCAVGTMLLWKEMR